MKTRKSYPEPEDKTKIERVILALYLFHTVSLALAVLLRGWSRLTLVPIAAGAVCCVYLRVKAAKTYAFRAYFTGCMLWMNLSVYALLSENFTDGLIIIAAASVLLALYCLPHIYRIGAVFFTALVLAHLFLLRDFSLTADGKGMRALMGVLSIYFIQLLAYYLVKMQQQSNLHMLENIESLRRAERSKDDFLANVSHELRTPVNTICGMSEILLQDELPAETRGYAYGIQMAGRNLLSLVSDILDFSELESGKISVLNDDYSITSVVNDVITTANAKNAEKHLTLIVDCDPAMPGTLVGDRQKICRAAINVLDNAIKFTKEGGVVLTIGTRREEYGVNLCITVQDTGVGIRPEMLERIFTSFNQADTRRNRAESGIGLGLAISKAIVEKMGGFLKIDSVYGEGTTVSIVIPQKIEDETPCISVNRPQDVRILVYLHFDNYKFPLLREGGKAAVAHMAARFDVTAFACRNLAEVQRRVKNDTITHIFIGWEEYREAPAYFEEIAGRLTVALIVEPNLGQELPDSRILCINAPLYALSVASILNGEAVREMGARAYQNHFIAPDAQVLVVDDSLMNLKVVEGLLRPYQLKLSVAQSGREALAKLESKAYDFIFMDHMMPEMDGVETFHRIREKHDPYYKTVPIIALTANAVGNAREMFLNEGFSDYISKPIETSALEHILRKFIPKEKVRYAQKESRAAQPKSGAAPENFADTGIDRQRGIVYCGGRLEDYLEIVRIYCADGEKNIRRIRQALESGDWKSFVIVTHTVKSTSKSIGAEKLSELAKELEADGKAERFDGIREKTDELLSEYSRVLHTLKSDRTIFPEGEAAQAGPGEGAALAPEESADGEETALTAEQFAACCETLAARLDSFDGEAVADYLESLRRKTYRGAALTELLEPVRAAADDFDFLGAADALRGIGGEQL